MEKHNEMYGQNPPNEHCKRHIETNFPMWLSYVDLGQGQKWRIWTCNRNEYGYVQITM